MANQNSYNYRQNLQFTSDQPNFLKLLTKQSKPVEVVKQASNFSDEAPQIELGKGVLMEEAELFLGNEGEERSDRKKRQRESFFRDKNQPTRDEPVEESLLNTLIGKREPAEESPLNAVTGEDEQEPVIQAKERKTKQTFGKERKRKVDVAAKDSIKKAKNVSLLSFEDED